MFGSPRLKFTNDDAIVGGMCNVRRVRVRVHVVVGAAGAPTRAMYSELGQLRAPKMRIRRSCWRKRSLLYFDASMSTAVSRLLFSSFSVVESSPSPSSSSCLLLFTVYSTLAGRLECAVSQWIEAIRRQRQKITAELESWHQSFRWSVFRTVFSLSPPVCPPVCL